MLLAWLGVLSLLAVVVSLHTNGSGQRQKAFGAPSYGFAGYTAVTTVNQISARWRVPFITSTPIFGAASTWIAAQSNDGHFIQLGTTENVVGLDRTFNVFWSDPVVHFEPQSLGLVAAGNLISYSMTKTGDGWSLRFDDRTTSKSRHVVIRYGQTTTFNEGEWIQEDPTFANFSAHLDYPDMSLVTISRLELNRQRPHLSYQYAQAMSSSNGVFLIPSKVHRNSFTFHHAKGAALQYLRDVLPLNTAMYPFSFDAQDNVAPSRLTVHELLNSIHVFIATVKAQRWPKATRPDVSGIVTNLEGLKSLIARWPVAPSKVGPQLFGELQNSRAAGEQYVLDIHSRLGLPPRD